MSGKSTIRVAYILREQDAKFLVFAQKGQSSSNQKFSDHMLTLNYV